MNKTITELNKDLKDIQTGFELLKIRKESTEMELRAIVMQGNDLLEIEHENSLEEQNWKEELENIEIDRIQEESMMGDEIVR